MKSAENPEIIQVAYGKTFNIGNYESIRLDLTARVLPGKTHAEVLVQLKRIMAEEEKKIRSEH